MKNYYNSVFKIKTQVVFLLFLVITSFTNVSYSQCPNGSQTVDFTSLNSVSGFTTTSCSDSQATVTSIFSDPSSVGAVSGNQLSMTSATIGDAITYVITFSEPTPLVDFKVGDIDAGTFQDIITFTAEKDGIDIPLTLTNAGAGTPNYTISGQTASGDTNNADDTSDDSAVLVNSGGEKITTLTLVFTAGIAGDFQKILIRDFNVCCPVEIPSTDLTITKQSTPNTNVDVGDTITYTIQVTNNSTTETVENISLQDVLPSGVSYVSNTISRTYNKDNITTLSGSFTQDLGTFSFSNQNPGTQEFILTSGSIPSSATLTSYSFEVQGNTPQRGNTPDKFDDDWRSDVSLDGIYPGDIVIVDDGTVDVDDDEFGGDNSGTWNTVTRSISASGSPFGIYAFDWYDIDPQGSNTNNVTKAEFTINYTYESVTRSSVTDALGTVTNLVESTENIDLEPGETITVSFDVTVDSGTECLTLTNSATANANNISASISDTSQNTVNPPTAVLTSSDADNTICAGDSITFTGSGGDQYEFFVNGVSVQALSTDNTYDTTTLTNGQVVTVRAVKNTPSGCDDLSDGITVTISPAPTAEAGAAGSICAGDDF
ncbi:hypothetical protein, partial [Tenacibaculum crassostreae]|uniref:hypothetical protein n=1 Tax=Tenacibaculum crassostreae TaxID=502683 RepID=UPI0038B6556D